MTFEKRHAIIITETTMKGGNEMDMNKLGDVIISLLKAAIEIIGTCTKDSDE